MKYLSDIRSGSFCEVKWMFRCDGEMIRQFCPFHVGDQVYLISSHKTACLISLRGHTLGIPNSIAKRIEVEECA